MLLTVAVLLAGSAWAQSESGWVCVPGEDGKWRCNQGGTPATAAPLPELELPSNNPGPEMFQLGVQDAPSPTDLIDQLIPEQPPADSPDRYTLKIASVSSAEDIAGFVESYGLDPGLVRFMPVEENGVTRQLIMWGSFSSPAQAARALVAMPSVVRAMRPQVSEMAGIKNEVRSFASLTSTTAAAPVASQTTRAPATAAAAAAPPLQVASAEPIPAKTRQPPSPNLVPAAVPAAKATPAPREVQPTRPATAAAIAENEPSAPPVAETLEVAAPSAPGASVRSQPSGFRPAVGPESNPPVAASEARPPASDPAPPQQTGQGRNLPSGFQPTSPASQKPDRPVRASATRPTRPPPANANPNATALGVTRFAAINERNYTIQLASLSPENQVSAYLQRHELSAQQVFAVELDEGAGPRILLLFGDFASFGAAETATRSLPGSIRSPWVRRVSPLQRLLRERK